MSQQLIFNGEITAIMQVRFLKTGALDCTFKMKEPRPENAPDDYQPAEVTVHLENSVKQAHPDLTAYLGGLKIHLARFTGQMGPLINTPETDLEKQKKPKKGSTDEVVEAWRAKELNAEFWESLRGRLRVNSITVAKGKREQIKISGQVEEGISGSAVALNAPLVDMEHSRYLYLDELAEALDNVLAEVRLYLCGKYKDAQGNLFEPVPDPASGKLALPAGARLAVPAEVPALEEGGDGDD